MPKMDLDNDDGIGVSGQGAATELLDLIDGGDTVPALDNVEGTDAFVNTSVKMKLNTFLRDGAFKSALLGRMNGIVKDGNILMAEGYAFANFHVLRLLTHDLALPKIDRNFYYRCLLAVGDVVCRVTTLEEDFQESLLLFDRLRPSVAPSSSYHPSTPPPSGFHTNPSGRTKVQLKEYNQMIASLSVQMATMASNHLLTNLNRRLESYLSWKHPSIKRFHKAMVRAVLVLPDHASDKILDASSLYKSSKKPKKERKKKVVTPREEALQKTRDANSNREASHRELASGIITNLRQLIPLKRPLKFATQAHQSLKLYRWLLEETEDGKEMHQMRVAEEESRLAALATNEKMKPTTRYFKGRLFDLLPTKAGFTTSYIPISSMFFFNILKSLGLSDHNGDGRNLDARTLWDKFFCLKLAETSHNRKFAEFVSTDGYAISVLVSCRANLDTRKGQSDSKIEEIRTAIKDCEEDAVRYGGVDPGFSDVVAGSFSDGTYASYSSSRYYEKARIKYSNRKTKVYNENKRALTDTLLRSEGGSGTASLSKMEEYLRRYLGVLREVHADRMMQKYRKMRFLRYVSKQMAVREIVDILVGDPKNKTLTVIGFGDWSGGSQSPISRKHSGPIQLIKEKIGRRPNAMIIPVDEYLTSQVDSNTWLKLRNMKAQTTVQKKRDGKVTMQNQKVHKVLHCKPSEGEKLYSRRETTWNRDLNASKNILMLLRMSVKGYERPAPFRRQERSPAKTTHGPEAGQVQVMQSLYTASVILAPPSPGTTVQNTTDLKVD